MILLGVFLDVFNLFLRLPWLASTFTLLHGKLGELLMTLVEASQSLTLKKELFSWTRKGDAESDDVEGVQVIDISGVRGSFLVSRFNVDLSLVAMANN